MRIVCPKCELKGQIDVTPTGAKTRIACVRCATTFDAVFAGREIQALLPQAGHAGAAFESVAEEVLASEDAPATEFAFTPVTPHENQFDASLQVAAPPSVPEVFFASTPDLMSEESETAEPAQAAPQDISQELAPENVEPQIYEMEGDGQEAPLASVQSLKNGGAGKVARPPADAYGMGVRLMRVSPLWLLLTGLSFISFIVFCNWLIKPTEAQGDVASLVSAAGNHATNQSINRTTVTYSTAQSPVNSQVSQSSNDRGVAFIETQAKEMTPTAAAPKVETVEAKPASEDKAASPAPTPSRAGEAKEGKVTIQVGAYNVATEAAGRVAALKSAGFEARSVEVEIPKRGTWYRVQSGRFVTRDEAERYGRQLRDRGVVSSFITTDVQE
jgi:cell division septation protein DedD